MALLRRRHDQFAVILNYPTVAAARDVFEAPADGGRTVMPMGKTFWAEAFGLVVDRFGTSWMINGGELKI